MIDVKNINTLEEDGVEQIVNTIIAQHKPSDKITLAKKANQIASELGVFEPNIDLINKVLLKLKEKNFITRQTYDKKKLREEERKFIEKFGAKMKEIVSKDIPKKEAITELKNWISKFGNVKKIYKKYNCRTAKEFLGCESFESYYNTK